MTNDNRFNGIVQSATYNGKAVITVAEDALLFEDGGKALVVPYAELNAFAVVNFRFQLETDGGHIEISQMGRDAGSLYEKLWDAYNARTLQAFFVQSPPQFEAQGEYRYSDDGGQSQGVCKVKLFDNCLCILPPTADARRIPLCFLREPEIMNFTIKLTLDTDETYEVIRLGDHTKRLFELINQNLTVIHQNAVASVRALDETLAASPASSLAWLVPDGAAAGIPAMQAVAPSFVKALEVRIAQSRAADTYAFFREFCPAENVYAGIKTGLNWGEEPQDVVWVTAVTEHAAGGAAAVELALGEDQSAATYIYRFGGRKDAFFKRLNHAMEAIAFHREVISLSDEELKKAPYALYAMAVKRTGALRFLRACLKGRAIHRSLDSWKQSVREQMG